MCSSSILLSFFISFLLSFLFLSLIPSFLPYVSLFPPFLLSIFVSSFLSSSLCFYLFILPLVLPSVILSLSFFSMWLLDTLTNNHPNSISHRHFCYPQSLVLSPSIVILRKESFFHSNQCLILQAQFHFLLHFHLNTICQKKKKKKIKNLTKEHN